MGHELAIDWRTGARPCPGCGRRFRWRAGACWSCREALFSRLREAEVAPEQDPAGARVAARLFTLERPEMADALLQELAN